MAKADVEKVVGRAATDSFFRDLLINNPEEALKEYSLSHEERESLLAVQEETLTVFSQSLDQRISKGAGLIGG